MTGLKPLVRAVPGAQAARTHGGSTSQRYPIKQSSSVDSMQPVNYIAPMPSIKSLPRPQWLVVTTFFVYLLLNGCAPISSTTDWRNTPKVVMQVCVPSVGPHTAEIVYYRPQNLGVWSAKPIAKTEAGQELFEGSFEEPMSTQTGFAVRAISAAAPESKKYFIYLARSLPTSDWSSWRGPDTVQDHFPTELTILRRGQKVGIDDLKVAPRIRLRAEYLKDLDRTQLSRERYVQIPRCD